MAFHGSYTPCRGVLTASCSVWRATLGSKPMASRAIGALAGRVRRLVQAASGVVDGRRSEQPAAGAHERAAIELRSRGASRLDLESVTRLAFLTCRVRVAGYGFKHPHRSADRERKRG